MKIKSTAHSTRAALSQRVGVAQTPNKEVSTLVAHTQTLDLFAQLLLSFSPIFFNDLAAAFSDFVDKMTPVALLVAAVSLVALVIQYLSHRRQCLVSPTYDLHTPELLNFRRKTKQLATATDVSQPLD